MAEDFATDWRKRVACVTCRKNKIRCEFSSPQSDSCKSCLRKGVECVMASSQRIKENWYGSNSKSPPKKRSPAVKYAWLGTRHATTPQEKGEKMKQLEKVLTETKAEINKLKGIPVTDNHPIHHNSSNPADWTSDILQTSNCVQMAIDLGLLTKTQAIEHFTGFMTHMAYICVGLTPSTLNFDTAVIEQPISTLAMVVAHMNGTLQQNDIAFDSLVIFLERLLNDRVFSRTNLDVIRALVFCGTFLQPVPQPKISHYVMMACCSVVMMDLGGQQTAQEVKNGNTEGARLYLTLFATAMGLATKGSHDMYIQMMPKWKSVMELLETYGGPEDKFLAGCCKLFERAIEVITVMGACRNNPLQIILEKALEGEQRIVEFEQEISNRSFQYWGNDGIRLPFQCGCVTTRLNVAELTLNRITLNQTEKASVEQITAAATNIRNLAGQLIAMFVDLGMRYSYMPQWTTFYPLQAITALLRLRAIMDSLEIPFAIDIDIYYSQIVATWEKNHVARQICDKLHLALHQIEVWMARQTEVLDMSVLPTSGLLHMSLRDTVIMSHNNQSFSGRLNERLDDEVSELLERLKLDDNEEKRKFTPPPDKSSLYEQSISDTAKQTVPTILNVAKDSKSAQKSKDQMRAVNVEVTMVQDPAIPPPPPVSNTNAQGPLVASEFGHFGLFNNSDAANLVDDDINQLFLAQPNQSDLQQPVISTTLPTTVTQDPDKLLDELFADTTKHY